jgi:putative ATPase
MQHPNAPLPKHLLNAPTKLHKELGHGRGYKYPHNFEGNYVVENYLPVPLSKAIYYQPSDQGDEARIRVRLEELRQARSNIAQGED